MVTLMVVLGMSDIIGITGRVETWTELCVCVSISAGIRLVTIDQTTLHTMEMFH